ncbi:MAG TPA: methyltransferase, partial [Bryobacteraceae bacterium]
MMPRSSADPQSERPPIEQLSAIAIGFSICRALQTAAELELPDCLASGPLTVEDLAKRTNTHAAGLFRLLRALESVGVFRQVSPSVFANTPISDLIRKDVPGSQWAFLRAASPGGGLYEAWAGLADSVRTGLPAFGQVNGCGIWEFMRRNPERAAIFHQGMQSVQDRTTRAVSAAYDWRRFPVIADIGGGIGGQLLDIISTYPSCRGILFDQPEVIARSIPHDRIERDAGNFFQRVPSGADAYILRSVIHDWADEESVAILKTVRAATKPESRVILIEQMLPETPEFAVSKWLDLAMLVYAGGQERTATEYGKLLEEAGMEVEQIVPTRLGIGLTISY